MRLLPVLGLFTLTVFAAEAPADDAPDAGIAGVYQALEAADRGGTFRVAQAAPVVSGQLQIEPADEEPTKPDGAPISFDGKLDLEDPALKGKSIEELIVGAPLFPPIEGLEDSIWKNKNCGTCHQWTKERLCTQAKTYIGAEKMVERLQHPYGLEFKQVLELWAEGGCL